MAVGVLPTVGGGTSLSLGASLPCPSCAGRMLRLAPLWCVASGLAHGGMGACGVEGCLSGRAPLSVRVILTLPLAARLFLAAARVRLGPLPG